MQVYEVKAPFPLGAEAPSRIERTSYERSLEVEALALGPYFFYKGFRNSFTILGLEVGELALFAVGIAESLGRALMFPQGD